MMIIVSVLAYLAFGVVMSSHITKSMKASGELDGVQTWKWYGVMALFVVGYPLILPWAAITGLMDFIRTGL